MNRVFGKKKASGPKPPTPTLMEASAGVGGQLGVMDGKIGMLEKELKGYKDKLKTTRSPAAKKLLQKKAMDVLKRKRMYEQQRDNLMGQQFNIDQANFNVESAKTSVATVSAMKAANSELKAQVRQNINIDEIEDLQDDMAELMEDFTDINESLGRNFATPDDIDESELEAELDMLDDELEDEYATSHGDLHAVNTGTPSYLQDPSLPAQPTNSPGGRIPGHQPVAYHS